MRSLTVIVMMFLGVQSVCADPLCTLTRDPVVCAMGEMLDQSKAEQERNSASQVIIEQPQDSMQAQSCARYVCQQFRSGQVECHCE